MKTRQIGSPFPRWIAWLGGAGQPDSGTGSVPAVIGAVVLIHVALSWWAVQFALGLTAHGSVAVAALLATVLALLVGVVGRAVATGPGRGRGRRGSTVVLVAAVLGVVVGEFAALAVFAGAVDREIQHTAERSAESAPAVVKLNADLQQTRATRLALDRAVDTAREQRDAALEVARCEYHPSPACPQTRITGVPGSGPETRTDNDVLAGAQRELDRAVLRRDQRAAQLDAQIGDDETVLEQTRDRAAADADHGLAARWEAMQRVTSRESAAWALRLLVDGFFVFLAVLPAVLRRWGADGVRESRTEAHSEREMAELHADTAIAVKRAEVRAAVEMLWAEQQLAQARLAVEAQTEIDRAHLQRQVTAAVETRRPEPPPEPEPLDEDIYLPIAAEAHAASLAALEAAIPDAAEPANLPAVDKSAERPAVPVIPSIPEVTRAAARWIRPVVPSFVTRAIDTSTQSVRTARQVFEDVEHITFSLKRTRRITVEATDGASASHRSASSDRPHAADGPAQMVERRSLGEPNRFDPLPRSDGRMPLPPGD